jgi:hypothetical protein
MNRNLVSVAVAAVTTVTALWVGCGNGSGSNTTHTFTVGSGASGGSGGSGGSGASGGFGGSGGSVGGPGIQCNPVTNAGCISTSQGGAGGSSGLGACDYTQDMNTGVINGFVCFNPPNDAKLCDTCDATFSGGPSCAGGTTCEPTDQAGNTAQCARYCCTDADCGSGTCVTSNSAGPLFAIAPALGLCMAGAGDAGAGGAGGAGTIVLSCDAPAIAPSMGSCVTIGN